MKDDIASQLLLDLEAEFSARSNYSLAIKRLVQCLYRELTPSAVDGSLAISIAISRIRDCLRKADLEREAWPGCTSPFSAVGKVSDTCEAFGLSHDDAHEAVRSFGRTMLDRLATITDEDEIVTFPIDEVEAMDLVAVASRCEREFAKCDDAYRQTLSSAAAQTKDGAIRSNRISKRRDAAHETRCAHDSEEFLRTNSDLAALVLKIASNPEHKSKSALAREITGECLGQDINARRLLSRYRKARGEGKLAQ